MSGKIVFILGIVVLVGSIIGIIIKAEIEMRREKKQNEMSPLLTWPCKVVDKRVVTSQADRDSMVGNAYYITCEFEDGTRRETAVFSSEYGLLVVGDDAVWEQKGTNIKVKRINKKDPASM